MLMKLYELKDNRYLGVSVLEILSYPEAPMSLNEKESFNGSILKGFKQLLSELHKLGDQSTAYELLWLTEKASNQLFASSVRIFFVLRKIDSNQARLRSSIEHLRKHFSSALSSWQYVASDRSIDELVGLVSHVNKEHVCGIVKAERYAANSSSAYPYYFTDVVPNDNSEYFASLVEAMSETESSVMSFQLFPATFSDNEKFVINELTNELLQFSSGTLVNNKIYKDTAATEPCKFYSYYNERKTAPLFSYNFLIFGNTETCKSLSSRLISFLQSGADRVTSADFTCVDLTNEKIDLEKSFPNYVWNINAKLQYQYRNFRFQKVIPFATHLKRMPYLLSLDEASAFFRLPVYEKSMSALKNDATYQTHGQFADEVVDGRGIVFGEALSNGAKVSIGCPESYFAKHAMIVGSPGSGKTTFSIGLLLQFYKKGIPFLAIEPTKNEYRAMIDTIPELQIFTPGKNHVSPFILNPFIPPRGVRVEQYIPSLASAFKAAFSMPNPLDLAFLKSIKECYTQYGWKDYSVVGDKGAKIFGLHEFILVFKEQIKNIYSDPTVRGKIESAGVLRLTNLIEQNSNIYDTVNTVPIEDMLTKPTVLELNAIENSEQKALLMALILIMVCVHTYNNQAGDGELKNILLIDEAHVLLGNNRSAAVSENKADSEGATVKALEDMIAAIRSYGTGIIIADQSAVSIGRRIVANTDIKIAFRLVETAEKEIIADSSNMDAQEKEQLSRLESGEAFVYHHKLNSAQGIRLEDIRKSNNIRLVVSDNEIAERMTYWKTREALLRPYHECKLCKTCSHDCDFTVRGDADYIAAKTIRKYRKGIVDNIALKKCLFHLPNLMEEDFADYTGNRYLRLVDCTRIKIYRRCLMELSHAISHSVLTDVIGKYPQKRVENE